MKITLFGDMMCEPPILKAAERADGTYSFDEMFEKVAPLFHQSDYVIGNLEFPLAGAEAGYTKSFFVFNAPDAYAVAVKNAGVDLISTVNNHTLDRGAEGILRTMRVLDEIGLPYVGTTPLEKEREGAYYFEQNGVKFAVVSYTYGINEKIPEESDCAQHINRLAVFGNRVCGIQIYPQSWVDKLLGFLPLQKRKDLKQKLGQPFLAVQIDNLINHELVDPKVTEFMNDIRVAKEKADVVLCYLHTGGQFNEEVGAFSKYVFEKARSAGADAVLACHSHIVQRAQFEDGILCAYSLGNFNMVPNSTVTIGKQLPEYCLAMHLNIADRRVEKVTFSILRAVQKKGEQLVVWPVDVLCETMTTESERKTLEDEVRQVYRIVTGKNLTGEVFRKEYELK